VDYAFLSYLLIDISSTVKSVLLSRFAKGVFSLKHHFIINFGMSQRPLVLVDNETKLLIFKEKEDVLRYAG
jgi:hypothetical protein